MNYLYLLSGIVLFAVIAMDIVKTTLSSKGGGVITSKLSRGVWNIFFVASGKNGTSTLLSYAGLAVLCSVLLFWVAALWLALFLMLLAEPDSIVNSSTMAKASSLEKLYYAGFTLSTLGVGDYKATSDLWRIVTSVAAFSGLAFITTSITYFVPVLQAVGLQSKLSLYLSSMGKTPQEILTNSWDGKGFSSFFDNTSDICQMLIQHTMHHHSYPVIHYFHKKQPEQAIAPAMVLLTETYHLLKETVSGQEEENGLQMSMLQTTLDSYLEMLKSGFLKDASPKGDAPILDLKELKAAGIPLAEEGALKYSSAQATQERRELLTLLLEKDGWSWQQVYGER
ncbi:potassium channel family protein [uncultured Pontibacter sp.]|uniref:potassium channel family protein n=1 Tax=uncultured Pontibacter sp. TaxID=453356 RepID=UPI00261069BD|nr:potassium channel family protein [uncultured Pontibacter sp.]